MININPQKIFGNWFEGYALDRHTVSSEFRGYDEFGHENFDTKRTEMGELLYKSKYRQNNNAKDDIIEVVFEFINSTWKDVIEGIIPIPPSNVKRRLQPVLEIAKGIADRLGIPLYDHALKKNKESPELKNIFDFHKRFEILKDIFIINDNPFIGKQILLFDDLFRSGATLNAATNTIYQQGKAKMFTY